jgi:hypothetical protein
MSDKPKEAAPPAEAPAAEAPKKGGLPVKTIAMIAVLLAVEAAIIIGAMTMLGKPSEVKGVNVEETHHDDTETLVEIPLINERFTNASSGRVWMWDTEIIIQSKKKHAGEPPAKDGAKKDDGHGEKKEEHAAEGEHGAHAGPTVNEELVARRAELRTGIAAIMASAQHGFFTEPGRETLSRQVLEYLRKSLGPDPEGKPRVEAVLIPRCIGMPVDY